MSSEFVRNLIRQKSLVEQFIPPILIMENCPEKDQYDSQLKEVRKKEQEVYDLYRKPFEERFEEKYKSRIQDYLNYLIDKVSIETEEAEKTVSFEYSCWCISKHLPTSIIISCMKIDVEIPFEYLFRKMSVQDWFTKKTHEKLL